MSVNVEARREARAIKNGQAPSADTVAKVALYGLAARALDPELLPARLTLDRNRSISFNELELILATALKQAVREGFDSLPSDIKQEINQNFNMYGKHTGLLSGNGHRFESIRLPGGCITAAFAEVVTIRTTSKLQTEGGTMTLDGLYATQRGPITLSMLHIDDLNSSKMGRHDIDSLYERWDPSGDTLSGGFVFRRDFVKFDSVRGLGLVGLQDILPTCKEPDPLNPHLGCLAMLSDGYLSKVHALATTAALEADLIHFH